MKTIKLKISEDITLIDTIHRTVEKNEHTWSEDGNTLTGTLDGGKITSKCPSSQNEGEIIIEMDAKAEKHITQLKLFLNQRITGTEVGKTVFKGITYSYIKDGSVMRLNNNLQILKELDKLFSQFFKKVMINRYPTKLNNNSLYEELTLVMSPYRDGLRSVDFDSSFLENYRRETGYKEPHFSSVRLDKIGNEPVKDIKLGAYKIGEYYVNRNLLIIYLNPLYNLDLSKCLELKDNKYVNTILNDLMKSFADVKPVKQDCERFKLKMMVSTFNRATRTKIKELKDNISYMENEIHNKEQYVTSCYSNRINYIKELGALDVVEDDAIESFLTEIEKVKKQKIVTTVTTDNGTLNITFKATTVKSRLDRNVEGKENGPFVECFVGEITAHIHGDGVIRVTCNHPTTGGNPHPHGNTSLKPCLGSGDGVNLLHKLIGEKQFSESVYVFWMWIKRWRNVDCYVHVAQYMDDRLKQGLPVFDQKGDRITLNDPKLIKEGILNELVRTDKYEANLEKYKDFKPQK